MNTPRWSVSADLDLLNVLDDFDIAPDTAVPEWVRDATADMHRGGLDEWVTF